MNDTPHRPPIHVEDLPWEEWSEGTHFGSRYRRLTKAGGGSHVGVAIEELPARKQSCPFHYHLLEEEHILALEGTAQLRLGDERYTLRAGDYVCFPAGQTEGHCLVNDGDAPFRFLIIGENNRNDVCVYPDSDKISVRLTGEIFRKSDTLEYWVGEPPTPNPVSG